jgi:hypothetical protein
MVTVIGRIYDPELSYDLWRLIDRFRHIESFITQVWTLYWGFYVKYTLLLLQLPLCI